MKKKKRRIEKKKEKQKGEADKRNRQKMKDLLQDAECCWNIECRRRMKEKGVQMVKQEEENVDTGKQE